MTADICLDPDLQDVSPERELEVKGDITRKEFEDKVAKTHCLNSLTEVVEECDQLAAEMATHAEPMENNSVTDLEEDPILENSLHYGEPLPERIEGQQQFNDAVAIAYNEDSLFKHILSDQKEHP